MCSEAATVWAQEVEALECVVEPANVRRSPTDAASLMVQVLFTSESNGDEYWVEVRRPEGYPDAAVTLGPLPTRTKLGTEVPTDEVREAAAAVAAEAAALGAEALFNVVTAAKEVVGRSLERDTAAALRTVDQLDDQQLGVLGASTMKRIAHDKPLVQVYRELDLTETSVLLTRCEAPDVLHALKRNVAASGRLYSMLHGDGVWDSLSLDAVWEVGFDSRDKSYAARRFRERRKTVAKAKRRHLLWHGSALGAIACILTNGSLRKVARPTHGRMFGDGVYFTDCMCKALTYCSGGRPDEFFLLLCSVALDNAHATAGYLDDVREEVLESGVPLEVQGALHLSESVKLDTGDVVAVGGGRHRNTYCAVNFNEFIVYQEDAHVNRYLVRLKVPPDGVAKRRIHGR